MTTFFIPGAETTYQIWAGRTGVGGNEGIYASDGSVITQATTDEFGVLGVQIGSASDSTSPDDTGSYVTIRAFAAFDLSRDEDHVPIHGTLLPRRSTYFFLVGIL